MSTDSLSQTSLAVRNLSSLVTWGGGTKDWTLGPSSSPTAPFIVVTG